MTQAFFYPEEFLILFIAKQYFSETREKKVILFGISGEQNPSLSIIHAQGIFPIVRKSLERLHLSDIWMIQQ